MNIGIKGIKRKKSKMNKAKLENIILEAYEEVLKESLLDELEDYDQDEKSNNPGLNKPEYNVDDKDHYVSQDLIRPMIAQNEAEEEEPTPEETPDMDAPEETVLEDATDKILGKFPTVKAAIIKLQTEDFKDFVESIDWVSPRPSSFRVNLKNGQDYTLKWMGEGFQATILGKRYYLNNISEYQQALDKLALLYKEAPMKGAGEEPADGSDIGDADTGGGDFPGGDGGGGAGGADDLGDEPAAEPADLSDEPVDFEAGEEPEA